jgi:hypothetical protein
MIDDLESISFPYDRYLTVRGLLQTHYGLEHGDEIYELLLRSASDAAQLAEESTGERAAPGILFEEDGGEFVGIESPK